MFFSLLPAAMAALAVSSQAAAGPVDRRATGPYPIDDCTTYATGTLKIKYNPVATGRNAGVISGVTHSGIDGHQDSLLVTTDGNGNNIGPQQWEFARCSSITSYDGMTAGTSGSNTTSFGIVRPAGAHKHCLSSDLSSSQAKRVSTVDADCTNIPEKFRTFTLTEDNSGTNQNKYTLSFGNYHAIIGYTKHYEVAFVDTLPLHGGEVLITLSQLGSNA